MPEVMYWNDEVARAALMQKGRAVFERIRGALSEEDIVVTIEPSSGAYYVAATLGRANDMAYEHYPDQWMYSVRTDDLSAELVFQTWR